MMTDPFPRLWTLQDVSSYLCVPVGTLYQWRSRKYGPPGRKVGGHIRYSPQDVIAWFESQGSEFNG